MNQGFGKDFLQERRFSEEVRAIHPNRRTLKLKAAVLISFPKLNSCPQPSTMRLLLGRQQLCGVHSRECSLHAGSTGAHLSFPSEHRLEGGKRPPPPDFQFD